MLIVRFWGRIKKQHNDKLWKYSIAVSLFMVVGCSCRKREYTLTTIVILSKKAPQTLIRALVATLGTFADITQITPNRFCIIQGGFPQSFLIYCTAHLEEIQAEKTIVIPLDVDCVDLKLVNTSCVFVLDSSKATTINPQLTGIAVLSCGFKTNDTITLSSFTHDSAVISLQRNVATFCNKTESPTEFPILLPKPCDASILLILAAILIISGNAEQLASLDILLP